MYAPHISEHILCEMNGFQVSSNNNIKLDFYKIYNLLWHTTQHEVRINVYIKTVKLLHLKQTLYFALWIILPYFRVDIPGDTKKEYCNLTSS